MTDKWVYLFSEVAEAERAAGDWDGVRALLGGKGAHLAEMTRLGLPVPPGFTLTTRACKAYLAQGERLLSGMWEQVMGAMHQLEALTGRHFGDPGNPLLVSCRSGAKISMPGMMDTVLNIGLNAPVAAGMIELTANPRFVHDAYRRLIQMFGTVVLDVPGESFEAVLAEARNRRGVRADSALTADDLADVTRRFQEIVRVHTGDGFPEDPEVQLRLATEAVFRSWNGRRAVNYRNAAGIAHDLGTAVNIVAMVFGNLGTDSATGVVTTRNATNGAPELEGDYLVNAQGEDVVAGTRATKPIATLAEEMPRVFAEFHDAVRRLERHFRDMQDVEFTIERGRLWLLQTRDGKRTAQAEVRIAVDMAEEGLISREEAIRRVKPEQVDFYLHPQFEPGARRAAVAIASGLNVSPGAAVGKIAFDADTAERWAKVEKQDVIMVRPETKPDDVHGMLAARGILTSRGGRTSHAALVARQFGKPAVVGAAALEIDLSKRRLHASGKTFQEGDWLSVDGTSGEVYAGRVKTIAADLHDPYLVKLLGWADEVRRLEVWANADYPRDARRALELGAQGIGLCRTEHMFFETERLPLVQRMILAGSREERQLALDQLLPFQRADFEGIFRVMAGRPVIIRLIDPPMHEFLPGHDELLREVAELGVKEHLAGALNEAERVRLRERERLLEAVEALREANPMLGLRGVRLGIHIPELTAMQVRAIFEAACACLRDGIEVHPEVMIPLTSHVNELRIQRRTLEEQARRVMEEQGVDVGYKFGTMIEIPRAALTADELAGHAEFFSFGTNDLTQTTFGISRDDAEAGFLLEYLRDGILPENPFASLDEDGVGRLMEIAVRRGRQTRSELELGICGEHGGDPKSIHFCHRLGLDYVSCSPFRVPVARLAAAQAALAEEAASVRPQQTSEPGTDPSLRDSVSRRVASVRDLET